jgi:enoyl-CoA hydratase/carnithine racemase
MRWAKTASGARLARSRLTNGVTKTMLHQEWSMTIEQSIEAEAQALRMLAQDFKRAYEAFVDRRKPTFDGN